MKVYLVNIENIKTRYPYQMQKGLITFFWNKGVEVCLIGNDEPVDVPKNMFLPFVESNEYKAYQTQQLASLFKNEIINNGDMIFFMDAWHPGVISARQMIEFSKVDVDLVGFWHAGSYDEKDLLGQSCRKYFLNFERSLAHCLDINLFATSFSKNLLMSICSEEDGIHEKSFVVGFPFGEAYFQDMVSNYRRWYEKKDIVIFPHRKSIEKHPEYFQLLETFFPPNQYKFIITLDETNSKEEYHKLLSEAKFSVSFAEQETFGISMVESVLAGCFPIMPRHKSYENLFRENMFFYDPESLINGYSACKKVANIIRNSGTSLDLEHFENVMLHYRGQLQHTLDPANLEYVLSLKNWPIDYITDYE